MINDEERLVGILAEEESSSNCPVKKGPRLKGHPARSRDVVYTARSGTTRCFRKCPFRYRRGARVTPGIHMSRRREVKEELGRDLLETKGRLE